MATTESSSYSAEERYRSKPGALGAISKGNREAITRSSCYDAHIDYTSNVNNWLHRTPYFSQSERYGEQRFEEGRTSVWECDRSITFQNGVLTSNGWGSSKREARNRADHGIYDKATGGAKKKNIDMINNLMGKPVVQMDIEIDARNIKYWQGFAADATFKGKVVANASRLLHLITQADGEMSKESNQGLATQESTRDSNTIITRDEGLTEALDKDKCPLADYLSAEKLFQFPDLIGRWMPLAALEVKTEQKVSDTIATYYLPEDLFTKAKCAPNLVPFEAFIYSQLDIEFRFVVNAQRFQCGKVIASVKFDSYQADAMQNTAMAALNRPHVVLDCSANNQGTLAIPFRYHRGFVRNVKNDNNSKGIRPSKFASVYVQYLSPLRTGAGGATNMFITPFYRITNSKFAAMSYRVAVQMDLANDVINTAYKSSGLKSILTKVENMALQFGGGNNRDRPVQYESHVFIPRPRMNFGSGKGLSDVQPLRNNPLSLTSTKWIQPFDNEPQTTTQIARIWGLRDSFTWKADNAPGDQLWMSIVDPCSRSYSDKYQGTPSPVEYVCGMYNFWCGALEYRFDFVSNAFHTGAVMITIEFGRPVVLGADMCSKASTYTKTFHLGEQKSVKVTVPYIYDTVFRRTTGTVYNPNFSADGADAPIDTTRYNAAGIRPESKTLIRVSVVNDLRPIATTTQEIDVLVYLRAGDTFVPHCLKQMSYVLTRESSGEDPKIDSFPRDGYNVGSDRQRRDLKGKLKSTRDILLGQGRAATPTEVKDYDHKFLPPGVSNEWNEYRQDKIPVPSNIHVQADTGEKEDEDPTADFSQGRTLLKLQTSDLQTSIKDILRRPVLMVYRHTVNSNLDKGEQFFLPVMPPSREMNYHKDQATEYCQMVGQTPQAAIMNLFRFWRGSSRFIVFVHSGGAEPLYMTYMPHSGTRIIGNQVIGNDLAAGKERPIMASGLATEPLLAIVNSSGGVECPYETENPWTLTFEENTQRNYSWRDKGDTNAGHLVLTATTNTQVSIWWQAADDFEVANFYGIPECKNRDAQYQWSDAHARVQMDEDFRPNEGRTPSSTLQNITNEIKKLADPRVLTKAAIGSIPMVGPALAGAPVVVAVEKLADQATSTMLKMEHTLGNIATTAECLQGVTNQLTPIITAINSFMDTVRVPNVGVWSERLVDFIMDLSLAWYQKSWVTVGTSCVKMLAKILVVKFTDISNHLHSFVEAITSMVRVNVQAPSATSTLIGAIAGIVGVAIGARINQDRYSSYTSAFSQAFLQTSGVSYLNQVIRFVQTTFDVMRDMVMEALGYASPEAVALKMLSGKDLILKNFIVSAQAIMNEANASMLLHPGYRVRFWYTVTQAYQIQQVLAMVPANVVSPQLSKLCSEIIRLGNENMVNLGCSPVRYEPFVVCLEGKEGIGKSHLTDKLVEQLLLAIGYTKCSAGYVYTRAPGSKHWNGYMNQPAIVYDDFANLNNPELMSQQISELYQIKSTATFIPEMAHLDAKNIKANPILVVLLTNGAFPSSMANVANHPRAVYRRRDVVLKAEMRPEFEGQSPRDLPEDVSVDVGHIQFTKFADPCDQASCSTEPRSWNQTINWLASTFKRYHAQEEINVRCRIDRLRSQLQIDAAECFDFEDPFALLYRTTEFVSQADSGTNAWLPSEKLEAAVTAIVEQIKAKKLERTPIIVPPPPDNIFVQFDCCPAGWLELAKYFTKGAIMTPSLWRKVLDWTADGLNHAVDWAKKFTTKPIVGECCVCMEEVELAYGCVDSENRHKVCSSCWNNVRRHSPTVCCPVCRSRQMGVLLEPADGLLATILIWLTRLTGDYIVPAMQAIARCFGRLHTRALSKIQFLSDIFMGLVMKQGFDSRGVAGTLGRLITAEIIEPDETWHDAVGDVLHAAHHVPVQSMVQAMVPVMRHLAHDGNHILRGEVVYAERTRLPDEIVHFDIQADDDWDIPPPRDLRELERTDDPLSRCELNEQGFLASRTPKVCRLPQCYHQALTENIDTIIYRDSQIIGPAWQLPMEIGGQLQNIMVLDFPCQHNCVWEVEAAHREFCTTYIARNQARISRAQIQYVSALQNNPVEFLKTIPRFARPSWAVENNTIPPEMTTDNWWTYLSEPWEKYKNILMITGMIAGAMGAVYVTYSQISSWFGSSPPAVAHWPSAQGDPNYNPEHARFIQRAARDVRATRTPRVITSQGDNLSDVVEGYVCNNYIRIVIDGEQKQRYLTAIGIFGHYAILPRHYVKLLTEEHKAGKKIYIAHAKMEWAGSQSTRHLYNFDDRDFRVSPITDIALFKLPASFRMFKDIRKFLCLQKDLSQSYINSEGKIILSPTRDNQIPQVIPIVLKDFQQSEVFNDSDGTQFEAFNVLHYAYSKLGACGSVVCVENSQRPIVAMHCAGQGEGIYGEGYGVLLTQECFEGMFEDQISVQCEEVESGSIDQAQFIFDEECQVTYLGTVPPNLQPHIPQKTKIEKSLLHNQYGFQAKTEPTILSPRDPRHVHNFSPLYYGSRKHGLKTKDFTTTQIERAGEALWDRWLAKLIPAVVEPQRLTPEQAVLGFEGNKYYEALSMNTSAGYPWNLSGNTSKENWIKVDWEERTCVIEPKLRREIERKEKLRQQGIVPRTVFVDTLKDERKLPHKVRKAGGTRVFCASPVDYTIALRQNLLHFCAAYMKDRHQQMHGVGIDVHGTEWSRLWTRLTRNGTHRFVGLDYSNFGPGFNARVARKASELMNRWTLKHVKGTSKIELDALGWECDHSVHLCGNTLYQQEAGSPSGASITVIKNSLVNLLYVLCAWDALCAEHARTINIDIWAEFEENIELCVYGDDLVMTVSEFYADKFNMQTIQAWFAKYGIVSTDASKSGEEVTPFVGAKEITFLKRGWRKHPTRWLQYLAPLDMVSINDITQWIWRSPDRRQATRVNCESALLEAHGSGPEVYEALRLKINEALVRIHVSPITMSWEDVDRKYYDDDTFSGTDVVWG